MTAPWAFHLVVVVCSDSYAGMLGVCNGPSILLNFTCGNLEGLCWGIVNTPECYFTIFVLKESAFLLLRLLSG